MRNNYLAVMAGCALMLAGGTRAAAPDASQLERILFLSMMTSPELERSWVGMRMLIQQFPLDDEWCDYLAERLLNEPDPRDDVGEEAVAWYVRTLRDDCSARYRKTLQLARPRFTREMIVRHLNIANTRPPGKSVPQYVPGSVDLIARQIEMQQQLTEIERGISRGVSGLRHISQGALLGEVIAYAGFPRDLSNMSMRNPHVGYGAALMAHYDGSAMLAFRHDDKRNRWYFAESFPEPFRVSAVYSGPRFAAAQALACLRSADFRDHLKIHDYQLRRDPQMIPVLASRLSTSSVPADEFEEDALLRSLKYIYMSGRPDSVQMLRRVGAMPGDRIPATARIYANKLELHGTRIQSAAQ